MLRTANRPLLAAFALLTVATALPDGAALLCAGAALLVGLCLPQQRWR